MPRTQQPVVDKCLLVLSAYPLKRSIGRPSCCRSFGFLTLNGLPRALRTRDNMGEGQKISEISSTQFGPLLTDRGVTFRVWAPASHSRRRRTTHGKNARKQSAARHRKAS
jgi:hypothetical protein